MPDGAVWAGGRALVTQLIEGALQGDPDAYESLRVAVYDLIYSQAERRMRGERKGHTLRVTELAHEIWMRLDNARMNAVLQGGCTRSARALIGTMIRNFLVDYGRKHRACQRAQEGYQRESCAHQELEIEVDLGQLVSNGESVPVPVFVAALEKLAEVDGEASDVFNLRVFGGLPSREIAKDQDRSVRSVQLAYTRARMFLAREMERSIAA